jgi:5-enolpyruvylshikimate-3-phosphate synthase
LDGFRFGRRQRLNARFPDSMPLDVTGDVTVPGDKSITHRALMLAAAATGESRLSGLLPGEDCRSTAAVLRALGCDVPAPPDGGGEIVVRGNGLDAGAPRRRRSTAATAAPPRG